MGERTGRTVRMPQRERCQLQNAQRRRSAEEPHADAEVQEPEYAEPYEYDADHDELRRDNRRRELNCRQIPDCEPWEVLRPERLDGTAEPGQRHGLSDHDDALCSRSGNVGATHVGIVSGSKRPGQVARHTTPHPRSPRCGGAARV